MRIGARLGVLALTLLLAGCAACGLSPPPPDPDPMDREIYRIGVTDILRINVWRNEELSVDVPVRPDGKISVPLLDDVQAEGLEPTELKEVLTRELSEYVSAPHVTVIILQMNSRFVSVLGGVNRETRVPLTRNLRVLEAWPAASRPSQTRTTSASCAASRTAARSNIASTTTPTARGRRRARTSFSRMETRSSCRTS